MGQQLYSLRPGFLAMISKYRGARFAPVVVAVCLSLAMACSDSTPAGTIDPVEDPADRAIREQVAALWIENRRTEALLAIQPLLNREHYEYQDLLNAGILEFALASKPAEFDAAYAHFEIASTLRPDEPAPYYNMGMIASGAGELERSLELLKKAHELAPDDYPTHLALANVLVDLDLFEEAEAHYRQLQAIGIDVAGGWYLSVIYRLGLLLSWNGDPEGQQLMRDRERLQETGIDVPRPESMRIGNFGKITWPRPTGMQVRKPTSDLTFDAQPVPLPQALSGMRGLAAWTVIENWERTDDVSEDQDDDNAFAATKAPKSTDVGVPDIGGWGPKGLILALHQSDNSYQIHEVTGGSVRFARAFDYDNDGDLDFLVVADSGVQLFTTKSDEGELSFVPFGKKLPQLSSLPTDVQPVDFDHEGDVDLLLVGEFGARLWRNDGFTVAPLEAQWTDATAEAKLPSDESYDWCLVEDFDTDQDVDLMFGGTDGAYLADNQRGGVFSDQSSRLAAVNAMLVQKPIAADLNGDAWPDLWGAGQGQSQLFIRLPSGKYVGAAAGDGQGAQVSGLAGVDLDCDGFLDATWLQAGGGAGYMLGIGAGSGAGAPVTIAAGAEACAWDDLNGDGAVDAVFSYADHAELVLGQVPARPHSIRLALLAEKRDNRRGLGAIVELRAGPIYRRIYWTGEPLTLGLGQQKYADILRVTWPRGVEQHDFHIRAGSRWSMKRIDRIEGSCPFLYTWNGEGYEFITDVLGITPLGLPMAPGQLVPPDHDEYVLVRGEQMKPRTGADGRAYFDMQFTEELREVTYLDRLRLDVVDHPIGTEIFPNERFSFPPFPKAHTHSVKDPLSPLSAVDDRGTDWTRQLAQIDSDYAIPFKPYRGLLTGLAPAHTLELSFDQERLADANLLRLVCTGWFLWSDASINIAAARTPGVDFIPPMLQVPDGEGGWQTVGPPVGFPAGKRKTMVLDVSDILRRDDPRIRIFSTLCLYWDSIRLAVDDDDASLITTSLDPSSANLWQRGFSRSLHPLEGHLLEWFDWNQLDEPRWNQHPGLYTKLGEVVTLMSKVDDQYAILGAGDALQVRFDGTDLPALPEGWRRDFLVYLDGWAKDRDPNSVEALYVKPLPFHGMSGYPYRADEAFPSDEAHRNWEREWNTRPARTWIEPLAPGKQTQETTP